MHLLALIIGPDKSALPWWQETVRAVLVFGIGLGLIRLSGLRTFSRFSPLDAVVTLVIGSNLGRMMTGNAAFVQTLIASTAFVLLHRLLAQAAHLSPKLAFLLKGEPRPLIVGGELDLTAMKAEAISHGDLLEAARLKGMADLGEVEGAVLERNGEISLRRKR